MIVDMIDNSKFPTATGILLAKMSELVFFLPEASRLHRQGGLDVRIAVMEGIDDCRKALAEVGVNDPYKLINAMMIADPT